MNRIVATAIVASGLLAASPARAELIRITPQGVSVSAYTGPTDPANISGDGFRLTYHGGGTQELVNPVMLILAVPDSSLIAPSLSVSNLFGFSSVNVDLGDTQDGRYGGTWDSDTGFAGTFDADGNTKSPGPNSKVYDFIGFTPQGSDSESYSNWSGATGLTSWNLFVYALTFDPLISRGDYVEFATDLPVGSYVVGYGCSSLDSRTGLCKNTATAESTPFTFAGLVVTHQVPEPATLLLLMPGFALLVRKRQLSA